MLKPKVEKLLWKRGRNYVAGVDEAGRGAWAGPLVAAAVIFTPKSEIPPGINDSKLLTPKKRFSLFFSIIKSADTFSLSQVTPREIDQWGITWATQQASYQAIESLAVVPDFILTDAYPVQKLKRIRQKAIIKGDQKILSIAAASILAKVYRDWLMSKIYHRQNPQYNFQKHKGYGTQEHRALIQQWGICAIHRRSYLKPSPSRYKVNPNH